MRTWRREARPAATGRVATRRDRWGAAAAGRDRRPTNRRGSSSPAIVAVAVVRRPAVVAAHRRRVVAGRRRVVLAVGARRAVVARAALPPDDGGARPGTRRTCLARRRESSRLAAGGWIGRATGGRGPRRIGGSRRGPCRPARSGRHRGGRIGSQRKAARIAAGTCHGRVGSSAGTTVASADREAAGVLEDQPAQGAGEGRPESGQRWIGRRAGGRREVARTTRRRRRRRPTGSRATSRRRSSSGGSCRRAAGGRRRAPRARAGTRDPGRGRRSGTGARIARGRGQPAGGVLGGVGLGRGCGRGGLGGRGVGGGGRTRRRARRRCRLGRRRRSPRRRPRGPRRRRRRRPLDAVPASTASTACSAAIASTSAWRFATCASSSRRSISRRTSAGGGSSDPGGAGRSSSGYSPLIHDIRRLRWRGFASRPARMIASASIAVTPGTWRVALADQRGAAGRAGDLGSEGSSAEHHMQRGSGVDAPVVGVVRACRTRYRVGEPLEYPDGHGASRRVSTAVELRRVTPTRSSPAASTRCRRRRG